MYRILIADDEEHIRTLLVDMIDMVDLPEGRELHILQAAKKDDLF